MELPRHDGQRKFPQGGALYVRMPASVVVLFYTKNSRIITETSIPYFLVSNGRDLDQMLANTWNSACRLVSAKHLSEPDKAVAKLMVQDIKELLKVD